MSSRELVSLGLKRNRLDLNSEEKKFGKYLVKNVKFFALCTVNVGPGAANEECKLTTPSNQLLCYFCGSAGSRYDSFIDLRGHLFEKHNKETRRLCYREGSDVFPGR
jgi:hypothetical protein